MTRNLHPKSKAVAHHLPHRTRLRLPRGHRDAATIAKVHKTISETAGVSAVEINARTGSVLIHHDEDPEVLNKVGDALEEVAGELFEAILAAEGIELPGLSIIAHVIRESMSHVDNRLAVATNNLIDLKMLVPVGFFAAGVIQSRRHLGWFNQMPAWMLFYFAYDAYMKFHGPSVRESSAEERFEPIDVTDSKSDPQPRRLKQIRTTTAE
jgi:hypothetical protein